MAQQNKTLSDLQHDNLTAFSRFPCRVKACSAKGRHFPNSTALVQHWYAKHFNSTLQCSFCGRRFKKRSRLESHVLLDHQNFEWQCPICWKSLKQYHGVIRHLNAVHSSKDPKLRNTKLHNTTKQSQIQMWCRSFSYSKNVHCTVTDAQSHCNMNPMLRKAARTQRKFDIPDLPAHSPVSGQIPGNSDIHFTTTYQKYQSLSTSEAHSKRIECAIADQAFCSEMESRYVSYLKKGFGVSSAEHARNSESTIAGQKSLPVCLYPRSSLMALNQDTICETGNQFYSQDTILEPKTELSTPSNKPMHMMFNQFGARSEETGRIGSMIVLPEISCISPVDQLSPSLCMSSTRTNEKAVKPSLGPCSSVMRDVCQNTPKVNADNQLKMQSTSEGSNPESLKHSSESANTEIKRKKKNRRGLRRKRTNIPSTCTYPSDSLNNGYSKRGCSPEKSVVKTVFQSNDDNQLKMQSTSEGANPESLKHSSESANTEIKRKKKNRRGLRRKRTNIPSTCTHPSDSLNNGCSKRGCSPEKSVVKTVFQSNEDIPIHKAAKYPKLESLQSGRSSVVSKPITKPVDLNVCIKSRGQKRNKHTIRPFEWRTPELITLPPVESSEDASHVTKIPNDNSSSSRFFCEVTACKHQFSEEEGLAKHWYETHVAWVHYLVCPFCRKRVICRESLEEHMTQTHFVPRDSIKTKHLSLSASKMRPIAFVDPGDVKSPPSLPKYTSQLLQHKIFTEKDFLEVLIELGIVIQGKQVRHSPLTPLSPNENCASSGRDPLQHILSLQKEPDCKVVRCPIISKKHELSTLGHETSIIRGCCSSAQYHEMGQPTLIGGNNNDTTEQNGIFEPQSKYTEFTVRIKDKDADLTEVMQALEAEEQELLSRKEELLKLLDQN